MSLSKSPDRFTFQQQGYLKRKMEEGKTPENDEDVAYMVEFYKSAKEQKEAQEADPAWAENNLEYDLLSTDWILEKVRSNESYAQNLYAAMCNNDFQQNDLMPILKGQTWSCSWRYAGGIIADMRQEGDYIDWYCSGIRSSSEIDDESYQAMSKEDQEAYIKRKNITSLYVAESVVTNEIKADLKRLGWIVVEPTD
jgi:hypothetical protein